LPQIDTVVAAATDACGRRKPEEVRTPWRLTLDALRAKS